MVGFFLVILKTAAVQGVGAVVPSGCGQGVGWFRVGEWLVSFSL